MIKDLFIEKNIKDFSQHVEQLLTQNTLFHLKKVVTVIIGLHQKGFTMDLKLEGKMFFRNIQTNELIRFDNAFIAEQHAFDILGETGHVLRIYGIATLDMDQMGILVSHDCFGLTPDTTDISVTATR